MFIMKKFSKLINRMLRGQIEHCYNFFDYFILTYVIIATEKVNRTVVALS